MKLSGFVITVFFGDDSTLRVTAGTSADQATDPNEWFTLNPREDDPASILSELLGKLKHVLENGGDGIDVTTSGRIITKTPVAALQTAAEEGRHSRPGAGPTTAKQTVEEAVSFSLDENIVPKPPLMNLNTASDQELRSLPGVGPKIAKRIVADRPFRSVEDLIRVDGIGAEKMSDIRSLVTVD